MKKTFIIEVAALCDFEDLDPEDRTEEGNCAVDGSYRVILTGELALDRDPTERALDCFHNIVPISCLEDFSIIARPAIPDDASLSLRADIGEFSEIPGPGDLLEAPGPGID